MTPWIVTEQSASFETISGEIHSYLFVMSRMRPTNSISFATAMIVGLAFFPSPTQVAAAPQASPRDYIYPPAAPGSVVDIYFGTPVADPYRWLENPRNPRTKAWISAEASLARRYLDSLPPGIADNPCARGDHGGGPARCGDMGEVDNHRLGR